MLGSSRAAYGYDVNSPEFKKWQAEQQQQYAQCVLCSFSTIDLLYLVRYYASQGYATNTPTSGDVSAPPPSSTGAPPPPAHDAQAV